MASLPSLFLTASASALPAAPTCNEREMLWGSSRGSKNNAAATAAVAHSNNKARKANRATTNCLSELD